MAREDKIGLSIIAAILFVIIFFIMKVVKWLGTNILGIFEAGSSGVTYTSAFLISFFLSVFLIIIFAVVSGGGDLLGELPFVLIGFFMLLVFFTFSIAFIF
jgi:hypothetical protein